MTTALLTVPPLLAGAERYISLDWREREDPMPMILWNDKIRGADNRAAAASSSVAGCEEMILIVQNQNGLALFESQDGLLLIHFYHYFLLLYIWLPFHSLGLNIKQSLVECRWLDRFSVWFACPSFESSSISTSSSSSVPTSSPPCVTAVLSIPQSCPREFFHPNVFPNIHPNVFPNIFHIDDGTSLWWVVDDVLCKSLSRSSADAILLCKLCIQCFLSLALDQANWFRTILCSSSNSNSQNKYHYTSSTPNVIPLEWLTTQTEVVVEDPFHLHSPDEDALF